MLPSIHTVLRRLLYEEGRIPPSDVDVLFDAPTRDWIDRRTQATIDLFLFDVRENTDLRQTSFQSARVNGRAERRLPPRRIDLRFMVSAHTTETEDEHQLLWRALVTLMQFPEIPRDLLSADLQQYDIPFAARIAQQDDASRMPDLWTGLNVQPHPAFCYVLTVPVDMELTISSPLVLTRTVRFGRSLDGSTEETNTHIGGIVRSKDGTPVVGARVFRIGSAAEVTVTNGDGEFRLLNVPSGSIDVRVIEPDGAEQTVTVEVPSGVYDIVLT